MQPSQGAGSDAVVATCKASAPGRTTLKAGRRGSVDTVRSAFAANRTHTAHIEYGTHARRTKSLVFPSCHHQ